MIITIISTMKTLILFQSYREGKQSFANKINEIEFKSSIVICLLLASITIFNVKAETNKIIISIKFVYLGNGYSAKSIIKEVVNKNYESSKYSNQLKLAVEPLYFFLVFKNIIYLCILN